MAVVFLVNGLECFAVWLWEVEDPAYVFDSVCFEWSAGAVRALHFLVE